MVGGGVKMSTSKEEIKKEIMEMFYNIITGDISGNLTERLKIQYLWDCLIQQIKRGVDIV